MEEARKSLSHGLLVLLTSLAMSPVPVAAEPIVRAAAQLEVLPVQGITLFMNAREAFETLLSAGFQAGELRSFDDWHSDGVEFVRGVYGSPDGHSSVFFSRRGERITLITETYSSPGNPVDAGAAIGEVRRRLGIAADDPNCGVAGPHSGTCGLQDATESEDVTVRFTLQILPGTRLISISRTKEQVAQ